MSNNLFTNVKKIPLYLAEIKHSNEKRKQGDTKIITLSVELAPFDAKLASAFDSDQMVRRSIFKLNQPEPQPQFKAAEFRIPFPRQKMFIFATIDSPKGQLVIDQVRVAAIRVRVDKKTNTFALVLKLAFGPAGKNELEFVEAWRTQTKAVTFEEAEKSFDFEDDEQDDDEDEEPRGAGGRPAPMFEDPRDTTATSESAAPAASDTETAAPPPDSSEEKERARQLPRRGGEKPGPRRVH